MFWALWLKHIFMLKTKSNVCAKQNHSWNAMAFYCYTVVYAVYQWGNTETKEAAVTLGEPEMAVTKTQRTKNNGSNERVTLGS